ncbi:MAG: DMT family transporter [Gammaproteobacteria bacterium]|nr:DMT family transporter [Gammaproteobacteria bacterium]
MSEGRADLLPSLGLAFGAALWGLYWIPIRGIEAAGVDPYWTGPVIFGATSLLFLPLLVTRVRVFIEHWDNILLPGLMAGLAFALYIASISLTDVVRALLLFYMTPLWSTLLGILFLGERLTLNRVLALAFAFAGLYVVLVVESGLPIPRNAGDWCALGSGVLWSVSSVKLFQDGARNLVEKVMVFVVCGLLTGGVLALLQPGGVHNLPTMASLAAGWPWLLVVAVMTLPVCYLTIWPASVLSPVRVGMLLMIEVVVGVISAAMLTVEPFGPREIGGTLLILLAGVVEIARQQRIAGSTMAEERVSGNGS